jgi:phage terminase large subunit
MSVVQQFSRTYAEIFTTRARYLLLWGGRGRGGSHTATNYFVHLLTRPEYFRGVLMRQVFSDIRGSLWRDIHDRIEENETVNPRALGFNDSEMSVLNRINGNRISSKGFKKSATRRTAKLKSLAGATHVIIEEADEIEEDDFMQLDDTLRSARANIQIVLIFNSPPKAHWILRRWFILVPSGVKGYERAIARKDPDLLAIFSTYRDNLANLNARTVANFEAYKETKPDHYWTMIMGLISEGVRGRIFSNWQRIKAMPDTYRKFYGVDWGFSVDPLAVVEVEAHGRKLWTSRKIYGVGILNDELDRTLKELKIPKSAPFYYDPSNPKDGEDMRRRGWNFIKAEGGPGSIVSTINYLKQFDIFVTDDSTEILDEFDKYAWALDQYKNPTGKPIETNNHAIDAIGYACDLLRKPSGLTIVTPGSAELKKGRRTIYNM